jgi:predicted permease
MTMLAGMSGYLDGLAHDVRTSVRSLRKTRGATLVIVTTLAVGISVAALAFSYTNAAILRPLPYKDAGRLVAISEQDQHFWYHSRVSLSTLESLRRTARTLENVAAYRSSIAFVVQADRALEVSTTAVDSAMFTALRVRPQLGRAFLPSEHRDDSPVVLISDTLWRSMYGSAPDVLGRQLRLGDALYTVVGVMPRGFHFEERTDVWMPLRERLDSSASGAETHYSVIGRLRHGATFADLSRELEVIRAQLASYDPSSYRDVRLVAREDAVYRQTRTWVPLLVILVMVAGALFLIATANVANLLMMRAQTQRRELAVRAALGASRSRMLQRVLSECSLIALASTGLALVVTAFLLRLTRVLTFAMPAWFELSVDTRVLAFLMSVAGIVVIAIGVSPAIAGMRADVVSTLRADAESSATGRRRVRIGRRAVFLQTALASILLVTATLLGVTYSNVTRVDLGYQGDSVLVVDRMFDPGYRPDSGLALASEIELEQHLLRNKGIAAVARVAPFVAFANAKPQADAMLYASASDRPVDEGLRPPSRTRVISDNYFTALGIRLLAGRLFSSADTVGTPPVAVVSRRLSHLLARDEHEDIVGTTIRVGRAGSPLVVVGIVEDVRVPSTSGGQMAYVPSADLYLTERQANARYTQLLIRPSGAASDVQSSETKIVLQSLPNVRAVFVRTLADATGEHRFILKVAGTAIGSTAIVALILAAVGVYAVVAFGVVQRSREIGIRLALGASPTQVRSHLTQDALKFASAGLAVGLAVAAMLGGALRFGQYGVSPLSPPVYLGVAVGFGALVVLSAYYSTRSVSYHSPADSLRSD